MLTHENPYPQGLNMDRKVKMQDILDAYITEVAKMPTETTLICGHLDASGKAYPYKGIMIKPLSGKETLIYEPTRAEYISKRYLPDKIEEN